VDLAELNEVLEASLVDLMRSIAATLPKGTPAPTVVDADGRRLHLITRRLYVNQDAPSIRAMLEQRALADGEAVVREAVVSDLKTDEAAMVVVILFRDGVKHELMLVAAKPTPWTAEEANRNLKNFIHEDAAPMDCGNHIRAVERRDHFTGNDFHDFASAIVAGSDSFFLLAHCKSTQTAGRKQAQLAKAIEKYGVLFSTMITVDERNVIPKRAGSMNIAGGYYALAPQLAFNNLDGLGLVEGNGILSMHDALDDEAFLTWVEKLAAARVHPDWPLRKSDHDMLKHALPYLKKFSSETTNGRLAQQLAKLKKAAQTADEKLEQALRERETDAEKLAMAGGELTRAEGELAQTQETLRVTKENISREQATWGNVRRALEKQVRELEQLRAAEPRGELMFTRGEYEDLQREFLRMQAARDEALGDLYWEKVRAAQWAKTATSVKLTAPETWEELLSCVHKQLPRIWMERSAVEPAFGTLDRNKESKLWLARTWTALCTLDEYAQHRDAKQRNFRLYVAEHPRPGLSRDHVVLRESDTVRRFEKLHGARILKTPLGELFFEAHIDIGGVKAPAPRLHFYDSADMILIGYIGPHLPNAHTS